MPIKSTATCIRLRWRRTETIRRVGTTESASWRGGKLLVECTHLTGIRVQRCTVLRRQCQDHRRQISRALAGCVPKSGGEGQAAPCSPKVSDYRDLVLVKSRHGVSLRGDSTSIGLERVWYPEWNSRLTSLSNVWLRSRLFPTLTAGGQQRPALSVCAPAGIRLLSIQRWAVATIRSRLEWRGVKPRDVCARLASATSIAASPGRRAAV